MTTENFDLEILQMSYWIREYQEDIRNKETKSIRFALILGGCTCQTQILDGCINRAFKYKTDDLVDVFLVDKT